MEITCSAVVTEWLEMLPEDVRAVLVEQAVGKNVTSEIAGEAIGKITSLAYDPDKGEYVLEMSLDAGALQERGLSLIPGCRLDENDQAVEMFELLVYDDGLFSEDEEDEYE